MQPYKTLEDLYNVAVRQKPKQTVAGRYLIYYSLFCLLVTAFIGYDLRTSYLEARHQAHDRFKGDSHLIAEDINNALHRANLLLSIILADIDPTEFNAPINNERQHRKPSEYLENKLSLLPFAQSLTLYGKSCTPSHGDEELGVNDEILEFCQDIQEVGQYKQHIPTVFIAQPNEWNLIMARPFFNQASDFEGLATLTISLAHYADYLQKPSIHQIDLATNTVRASLFSDSKLNLDTIRTFLKSGEQFKTFRAPQNSHELLLVGIQRIGALPIVLVASEKEDGWFASWRQHALLDCLTLILSLAVGFLILLRHTALRNHSAFLDTLLNNIDAHIYVKDHERRYLYANNKVAKVFDRSVNNIIGQREQKILSDDNADHFWKLDKKVFESGEKQYGEEVFVNDAGEPRYFWTIKLPIKRAGKVKALIGFSSDITELKNTQSEQRILINQLNNQNQQMQAILENVIDGIITIDAEGKITAFNKAAGTIFGYDKREIIGKNINLLMPEPYHSAHFNYLRSYQATGITHIINRIRNVEGLRKNGEVFPMDLAVTETKHNDKLFFIGVMRDLTQCQENNNLKEEYHAFLEHHRYLAEEERRLMSQLMTRMMNPERLNASALNYWIQPAELMAGDLLTAALSPNGHYFVMLADAMGHGLPAAINLLPLHRIFYTMVAKGLPLKQMVHEMNHSVLQDSLVGRFVAAVVLCYDPTTLELEIWNGGMPEVLYLNVKGEIEHRFRSENLPLGILEYDKRVTTLTYQCANAEQLFICSDGLTEMQNGDGDMLGQEAIETLLIENDKNNRLEAIKKTVRNYLQDKTPQDDVSLALVDLTRSF